LCEGKPNHGLITPGESGCYFVYTVNNENEAQYKNCPTLFFIFTLMDTIAFSLNLVFGRHICAGFFPSCLDRTERFVFRMVFIELPSDLGYDWKEIMMRLLR
jgi:hypothetical protein